MNITFGTVKRAGRDTSSNEKYPTKSVITIEGYRGEGKSRRILFNSSSMELLNIPVGAQQQVIFGFVEADENFKRRLLIANADALVGKENTVVYSVSKNKVSFEYTNEKGKGISNSPLHGEIADFLGLDVSGDNEFELISFGQQQGMDLYELVSVSKEESFIQDPKHLLTFKDNEELQNASKDNDIEKESIEDLNVRHREIEECDEDIKSQNSELEVPYESSAVEGGFESNVTENIEDWE